MSQWQHREIQLGEIRLHYVEAGQGPLVVLLHGFPEFWYCWRKQIMPLADAGYRVIVPDMRGYNLSSKPSKVADYHVSHLSADVAALIEAVGGGPATVVGHDWGGAVAWAVPILEPQCIDRLVILNAPHPAIFQREVYRPAQLLRSWYMFFFQLPWLPEKALGARDCRTLVSGFRNDTRGSDAFQAQDLDAYREAFRQPGALTGALNYYRAAFRIRRGLKKLISTRIDIPTMVIWGMADRYLGPRMIEGLDEHVQDLRLERLDGISHWVQSEAPQEVNRLLLDFLPAKSAPIADHASV